MYALQKILVQRECTDLLIHKLTLITLPLKQKQLWFRKPLMVAYYTNWDTYELYDNCRFIISCAPEGLQPSTVLIIHTHKITYNL
jgi:hypothetical protein